MVEPENESRIQMPNENRIPNSRKTLLREFDLALLKVARELLDRRLSHLMSPRNALVLRHGHGWEFVREDQSTGSGGMVKSTAEMSIEFEAQTANDTAAFRKAIESLVEQFTAQMSRRAYAVVAEAAEEVGNVVSAAEAGSLPNAFLRMIETIELGVDEDGQVSMPAIHATPELVDRMMRELSAQGPEFERQVEAIKEQKIKNAIAQEAARLGRYRGRAVQ